MDDSHFDQLARAFGALRTRRTALLLLGGVVASPALGLGDAEAKPKKKRKKPCKSPKKKCGGKCLAVQSDDNNCGSCGNRCSRTQTCRAGQCEALVPPVECPIGQCCEDNQTCDDDGRCRDGECQPKPVCLSAGETFPLVGDSPPCCSEKTECSINEQSGMRCICQPGEPSSPCLKNTDCRSGECVGYQCAGCPAETFLCNGECMTFNSEAHCGACGNACDPGEFCQEQACQPRYQHDSTWPSRGASDVFIDASRTVFVANADEACVRQFSEAGALQHVYGVCGEPGSDNRHLRYPTGVVAYGNVVMIADGENHRVQVFARNGEWIRSLVTGPGTGPYQVNYAGGLALDADLNIYVVDYYNHRVKKYDSSGTYVRTFGSRSGTPGSGENQFVNPAGVAVDRHGYVYVADQKNDRVQKFDRNGNYLRTFGSTGSGPGQLKYPYSVAVARTGDVFVVDGLNERVQQFKANGNVIRIFSGAQLNYPFGVAVDDQDNLYVADIEAHSVIRFKLKAATPS